MVESVLKWGLGSVASATSSRTKSGPCSQKQRISRRHRELDTLTDGIFLWIERTGLRQNSKHIIDTTIVTLLRLGDTPVFTHPFLIDITHAVPKRETGFIDGITFSFFGSLPKIAGFQLFSHDACQRIPHLKEEVGLFTANGQ